LLAMSILVIKISSIGDVILSTASLMALRKKFPQAKIYCLVGKESRKVLNSCPYVDGIIIYDGQQKERGWSGLIRLSRKLHRYRFDKIIDFQNSRKSHLLSFLSMPRESYGYHRKWGGLLTRPLRRYRNDIAAVEHQFQLLKELDISCKDPHLELWPSVKDKAYIQDLLDSEWMGNSQNIVGINISASDKWPTKNWPIDYISRVCDALSRNNVRVVITGMAKDRRLVQQLLSLTKSKPANFCGKTDILQLAALIKKCKVYITPDSAPLHIAAAVNTPVIALFGPTDSLRHIPPAKKMEVMDKKLACAPCYSSRCGIVTHACMKGISPQEVVDAVEKMMGAPV